jgi:ribose transport system substrate-binding protein
MRAAWRSWSFGSVLVAGLCSVTACSRSGCAASGGSVGSTAPRECTSLPPLAQKATYKVGFVEVYEPTNSFRITNAEDMVAEGKKRGFTVVYNPPTVPDPAEQVARVHSLIDAKVDAIIMAPKDAAILAPAVVDARKACIPVITENRFVDPEKAIPGKDYVTGIGADGVIQGQLIADWLIKATKGKAKIIELEGTIGSSPAMGRKKGFDGEIATQPGMTIVASQSGDFDQQKGHDVLKALFPQHPDATVIYTHNDTMALGSVAALKELGKAPGKDVMIVSVDGLKEAVKAVMEGTISAIEFNNPRFGAISFDTMETYAAGQVVPPKIIVKGPVIDSTNAAAMLAEAY